MTLAWLHPDCLNDGWWPAAARPVFVFDDAYLEAAGWGLKRILFVYETLLELSVEIHRGDTVQTLLTLSPDAGIITVDTPDPLLREAIARLRVSVPVELLPAPAFVELPPDTSLKRFSHYWSKAQKCLLK